MPSVLLSKDKEKTNVCKWVLFQESKVCDDTVAFRFQHRVTALFLCLFGIYYSFSAYNKPIWCFADIKSRVVYDEDMKKALNDYCWVYGTYKWSSEEPWKNYFDDDKQLQNFYQFIVFGVMAVVVLVLIPRKLWSYIEGGRLKRLIKELYVDPGDEEKAKSLKDKVSSYLVSHRGSHLTYAYGFAFCEVLNVVTTLLALLWLNSIWSTPGEFWNNLWAEIPKDKMEEVFSPVRKCNFQHVGPSGNLQRESVLCVLPLNVVNHVGFYFFWYYFRIILPFVSALSLVRVLLIVSPRIRMFCMKIFIPLISDNDARVIRKYCCYGDWFLLYLMSGTLKSPDFVYILHKFAREIDADELIVKRLARNKIVKRNVNARKLIV